MGPYTCWCCGYDLPCAGRNANGGKARASKGAIKGFTGGEVTLENIQVRHPGMGTDTAPQGAVATIRLRLRRQDSETT